MRTSRTMRSSMVGTGYPVPTPRRRVLAQGNLSHLRTVFAFLFPLIFFARGVPIETAPVGDGAMNSCKALFFWLIVIGTTCLSGAALAEDNAWDTSRLGVSNDWF